MDGIFYNADENGAEVVGLIDTGNAHSFDQMVVLRRVEDGALFYATDADTIEYAPFDHLRWGHMALIVDSRQFEDAAAVWLAYRSAGAHTQAAVADLVRRVQSLLTR